MLGAAPSVAAQSVTRTATPSQICLGRLLAAVFLPHLATDSLGYILQVKKNPMG
jgi:hypothetical protein